VVRARPAAGVCPGDRCLLAVRPENIGLGRADENTLGGRVVLASYLGNTLRYDIAVAGGTVLKVDVRDPWHHELLPVGRKVSVSFPASATLTLPDE
jgi:ABC-type Fe3+/spermidine/putrescine transport system ATPase subunit